MRKTFKQLTTLVLISVMALGLSACGKEKTFDNKSQTQDDKTVWYLGGNNIMAGDVDVESLFEGVEDTVDPVKIYDSITYTTKIVRGTYMLNNKEKDLKTVRKEIPFSDVDFKTGTLTVSELPVAVYLGAENICCSATGFKYGEFQDVTDCEVAVLELATEDKVGQTPCVYEIDGRTIIFKQIEQTSKESEEFTYDYTGIEFKYDFEIAGPYMTFSKDENSLKLKAYSFTENVDRSLSMTGYSLLDSPLIDELDYFASAEAWNYAVKRDGSYYDLSAYKLTDDGKITIYLADNSINGEE